MKYRLYLDLACARQVLLLLSQLIRLFMFACLPLLASIMICSGCHEIFLVCWGKELNKKN